MTHTALRSEFEQLIDVYAAVGQLGTGFTFTEGPIWHPADHYLLFSDMPADVRRRWDARGGVREVRRPSNKHNGMTYDADLNLIVCEHATSSLVRERPDGRREVLATHFDGQELNSPNDVCVHSERRDLFLRPLVWPHAGLRRRAAAPARLPGRLPHSAGRRRAAASRRPQPVRAAERRLLLARREAALRQRYRHLHDLGVRGERRRIAVERPHLRERVALRARARRAGRHEMRCAGQYLVHGAGRRVGLCAVGQPARQGARAGACVEPHVGRGRLAHPVHDRDALGLHGAHQGRAAPRALHAQQGSGHQPAHRSDRRA